MATPAEERTLARKALAEMLNTAIEQISVDAQNILDDRNMGGYGRDDDETVGKEFDAVMAPLQAWVDAQK